MTFDSKYELLSLFTYYTLLSIDETIWIETKINSRMCVCAICDTK